MTTIMSLAAFFPDRQTAERVACQCHYYGWNTVTHSYTLRLQLTSPVYSDDRYFEMTTIMSLAAFFPDRQTAERVACQCHYYGWNTVTHSYTLRLQLTSPV